MKKILPMIIVLLIVAGGSFFGGMKYGQSKKTNVSGNAGRNFQNLTNEQRQQMRQDGGIGKMGNGGFVGGEIISKDAKSITVKDNSGSTKIILLSDSTKVSKTVDGKADDLTIGKNIMVTGDSNSDGSVTAKTISERSADANNKMTNN